MEEKRILKDIINFISKKKFKFKSDPFFNVLRNYSQIKNPLELSNIYLIKYYYFSRKKIHIILYDEEEVINIKFKDEKRTNLSLLQADLNIKNLSQYFYFNLLIEDNINIINYTYSFDFIIEINNIQKNIKDIYTKIFLAKIINDLIFNYQGLDEYNEEKEEEPLKKIRRENQDIIKDKLDIFENINLYLNEEDILYKKIDQLLSDIIISLIKNEKLENCDLIKSLDLENIDITETIYNSLYKILDKDSGYINKYIIKNKKDLLNEKNINFYYILLKYILKNSIYIYQIPLLLELRKLILHLIKSKEVLYNGLNEEQNNKLEFIIKTLTDSEYYFNKSKNENKLTEVLNYYKDFKFISAKEDINILQDIIINNKKGFEKYLLDFEKAKNINIRAPIIKYLINLQELPENLRNENIIKKYINIWSGYEELIKRKKYKKMRKNTREILKKYFVDEKNKYILLKIFNQDEINSFINTKRNLLDKKEYKTKKKKEKDYSIQNNENNIYNNEDEDKNLCINTCGIYSGNNITVNQSEVVHNKNKEKKELNNNEVNHNDNNYYIFLLNILQKCEICFHTNEKGKDPFFIYDSILIENKQKRISYEDIMKNNEINDYLKKNEKNKLVINYKKFVDFLKLIEDKIRKEFKNNYKLEIKLEFKKENNINNIHSFLYNISCTYLFKEPIEGKEYTYVDRNILLNGDKSEHLNFQDLLLDINLPKYKNLKYIYNKSNNNQLKLKSKETLSNSKKDIPITGQKYFIDPKNSLIAPLKIIIFKYIIESNENYPIFIEELDDKTYIIKDSQQNILLYDVNLNKSGNNIKNNDFFYNDKISKKNFKIVCSENKISEVVKLDENELKSIKGEDRPLKSYRKILSYEDKSSLLFNNENINHHEKRNNISNKEKSIRNHKVLISDSKKNGIFLQNKLGDNHFEEYFYDTKNFEVYCLYPLLIVFNLNKNKNLDNININEEYRKKIIIIETNFLLVGGFDNDKKEGQIKLLRIEYRDNLWITKIKFLEKIIIPKNIDQLSPITNIIQSRVTGNILATSLNRNLYMFSEPKIVKNIKNEILNIK